MRAIKRQVRRLVGELQIGARRRRLERELSRQFGEELALAAHGSRGRDSIYQLVGRDGVVGVLRLVNPHKRTKPLASDSPFIVPAARARLEREWDAYACGAPHGLTPQPLWRAHDALLCAHVDRPRMSDLLASDPSRFWSLNCAAARAIARLHALGVMHMDACLANILSDSELGEPVLIDFEYAAATHVTLDQAQAYDYLRLLESGMKLMPRGADADSQAWISTLDKCVSGPARDADIGPLRPALERVLKHPQVCAALRRVFVRL